MNNINTVCKLIIAMMFGVLVLPMHGFALGLGSIDVHSNLNQPLDARIKLLSATPEDAQVAIVKVASREAFIKAGIDRPQLLTELKFGTVLDGDNVFITVKSPKIVREPSLNFLIEVNWPQGNILREYTLFLDPAGIVGQR